MYMSPHRHTAPQKNASPAHFDKKSALGKGLPRGACVCYTVPMNIPQDVKIIFDTLRAAGHEAYAVGGCVRDTLMGRVPNDWDVCTSARPEEIARAFAGRRTIDTGIRHGTLTVLLHGVPYEITTYRTDGEYSDHRRPDSVTFVRELGEDLARRDFTVNAMAADENGIRDMFGGREDIARRLVRCVGDPDMRFGEDALRILRAARFASVLDFAIEEGTRFSMLKNLDTLSNVSRERVYSELKKLICGPGAPRVIGQAWPVIALCLPGARPPQEAAPLSRLPLDPALRLGYMLRPLGRDGAEESMRSLKCDNAALARVKALAAEKEGSVPGSLSGMLRLLNRAGETGARDVIACERAIGTEGAEAAGELLNEALPLCWRTGSLAVNGGDLMRLGCAPGKELGLSLERLLNKVMDGAVSNEKEALLDLAEKYLKGGDAQI